MGRKVNPKAFRLGPLYGWDSRWFAKASDYRNFVLEDTVIRKVLLRKLSGAGIVKIEIERSINKINLILHVVRPGIVIGRGGKGIEEIKKFIENLIYQNRKSQKIIEKKSVLKLELKVEPVKDPHKNAYFVGSGIAEQLAKRMPHKRVVHYAMEKVMTSGAKGVKIMLSGRIAGAEISRRETYKIGTIPLSTIREAIDYACIPSLTKSGYIGVKVWICR